MSSAHRFARALVVLTVAVLSAWSLAGLASAQTESEGAGEPAAAQSVGGTLTTKDAETDVSVAVPGVTITVATDGSEVGNSTSDDDGAWQVAIDDPGVYEVTLDVATLPEGVDLRDPDRATLDAVSVDPGQAKVVRFLFGERTGGGGSDFERFINLVAGGVKFGAIIALAALGLSLIFGVTGLVNFAHGELVALGAIVAWYLNAATGGPRLWLVWATLLAMLVAGVVGGGLEVVLWRPLRRAQIGGITLLVVAIGVSLLIRHVLLIVYGGASRPYRDFTIQRSFDIGPLSLPAKDYVITVIALVVLVAVGLLLVKTRIGTAMRAVADNRDLAESSGIDVERVILFTWILGTSLAALGGVLQGVTEAVTWDMGFALLLLMFAAVILGGLGTAFGAMAGGLVIGLVSQVSTYWVSSEFKLVFALLALILVLMIRPQGIFGRPERIS